MIKDEARAKDFRAKYKESLEEYDSFKNKFGLKERNFKMMCLENQDYITCPNCEWEDKDGVSLSEEIVTCPKCGSKFTWESDTTYSTDLVEDEDEA